MEKFPRVTPREDTRHIMGPFKDILQGGNLLFSFSLGRRLADCEDIARPSLSNSLFPARLSLKGKLYQCQCSLKPTENELSITLRGESTLGQWW